MSIAWALLVSVLLLIGNAFFVAAEFALVASKRHRLEQAAAEGSRAARAAVRGSRELSLMLAGAQLGITMCSLGLGAVAEPALAHQIESVVERVVELPDGVLHAAGFTVALSIVVFLHLVVGEMAPKSWAIADPERSALALARSFRAFTLAFRPVIRVLNALANGLVRRFGVEPQDERAVAHTPADLLLVLDESARHGGIRADEHRLLTRSIELSGRTASESMTAREDVVAVAGDATLDDLARLARETGRSRLVVHGGSLDDILGVVHVKDIILLGPRRRAAATARSLVRPALVTTTDRALEDLLVDMRAARRHLAVVTTDDDRVAGIITLEDVLETIVGDFADETDVATATP